LPQNLNERFTGPGIIGAMGDRPEHAEGCGALEPGLVRAVHLLQEKWMLLIVHRLLAGPVGFNALCREADGVNATTMAQRLSQLEAAGLAVKTVHSTMPPRTSYELTAAGRELQPVLDAIEAWGRNHLPAVEGADLPVCTDQ
jgi:DNA-binding HxlR family transcriptional regulator